MRVKKNAINISIEMILLSLIIIALCWHGRNEGAPELLFVLASGVFGSSFATLWIFIYEYHQTKYVLLKSMVCGLMHFAVLQVPESGRVILCFGRHLRSSFK